MTQTAKLDPIKSIAGLDSLLGDIARRVSFARAEKEEIQDAWEGLGNAGGQRADHASMLLIRLEPHFADLSVFLARCAEQLREMKADPFGTK